MQWMATQIAVALVVVSFLLGCAVPVARTRPDGTPFESHAELMQYLKEHPEEKARIDPRGLLTTGGSGVVEAPSSRQLGSEKWDATRPAPTEPSPGSLAYLDARNGFRDLKFGDPPLQGMRLVEDHGDMKYYTQPSDDLTIGNAKIKEISYGFYKGRLSTVLLQTDGLINSRALLEVLRQAYGSGSRPNRFMDRYLWDGSRVLLYYDEKPISNDAIALFQSVPLRNEQTTDEKAKARKGASDL
jgi:hypothetical protein